MSENHLIKKHPSQHSLHNVFAGSVGLVSESHLLANLTLYIKILYIVLGILLYSYHFMVDIDLIIDIFTIILAIVTFAVLVKYKALIRQRRSRYYRLVIFTMLFSGMMTACFAADIRTTLIATLYCFIELSLLSSVVDSYNKSRILRELFLIAKVIMGIGTICLIISLSYYHAGYDLTYHYEEITTATLHLGRSDTGALTGILGNSNMLGTLCLIITGLALFLICNRERVICSTIIMLLSLYCTILTASRGAIYSSVMLLLLIFVFHALTSSRNRGIKLVAICIVSFVVIIITFFAIRMFSTRSAAEMTGSTSARTQLWIAGLRVITSNPITFFFGVGANFAESVRPFADTGLSISLMNNMHNTYMQTLVAFGFVGFSCLIASLLFHLRPIKSALSENVSVVAPLSALIVSLIVLNAVESDLYFTKSFIASTFWVILGYQYALAYVPSVSTGTRYVRRGQTISGGSQCQN